MWVWWSIFKYSYLFDLSIAFNKVIPFEFYSPFGALWSPLHPSVLPQEPYQGFRPLSPLYCFLVGLVQGAGHVWKSRIENGNEKLPPPPLEFWFLFSKWEIKHTLLCVFSVLLTLEGFSFLVLWFLSFTFLFWLLRSLQRLKSYVGWNFHPKTY